MTRAATFGLAALLLALALGAWGVSAYRKAQLHKNVAALVIDSSRRLESALALDADAATAASVVGRLDEQAQEVDKHVIELRDLNDSLNRKLVAAAEDYMLTARQILRQHAASQRYRTQVSASEAALREHMRAAGKRTNAWMNEAIRAKDRMEKNYFDYRVSTEALERLLASYPSARKVMARELSASLLADDTVENARKRSLAASKRVAANVEQARQMAAVH